MTDHVACPNADCEMHGWPLLDDTGDTHVCAGCGTTPEPIPAPPLIREEADDPHIGEVLELDDED